MENNSKKFKIIFWPDHEYSKIPPGFEGKTREIVEKALTENYLINNLQLKITKDGDLQYLGEEEFDARIEYSLKIDDIKTNEHLLHMINFFSIFLQHHVKAAEQQTFTCAISLCSKEFFAVDFNSAHSEIPTESCTFANLIERSTPYCHRKLKIERDIRGILSRYYGKNVGSAMITDLVHDKRELVLRFPYTERQNKGEAGFVDMDYVISLTVRYKQIRRILANLQFDNEGNQFNLELYFHLSSPPTIRRIRLNDPIKKEVRFITRNLRDQFLEAEVNESPIFRIKLCGQDIDLYCQILNRLAMSTEQFIEFRTFTQKDTEYPFGKYQQSPLENEQCKHICGNNYELMYMVEALLSRGAVVKDYLLTSECDRNSFIERIATDFKNDKALCLEVMEQLLAEIDKRLDSLQPLTIYKWIFNKINRNVDAMRQIHDEIKREGYVRVRKVVITPTRMLFVAPELLMGNRVLRLDCDNYPVDKFLRVVFRDDDGQPVHATNVPDILIEKFIGLKLRKGINVAGRHFNYFGSSNSQMRDNGCYFIEATFQQIQEIIETLGAFKIQSAPKMMSRIAQCFTQARETSIKLDRRFYGTVHDYLGGNDSKNEPYNFSDGVGRISYETAHELSKELKLEGCVPSCFQIRFRGYKGVLTVDKSLDEMREWGKRNGLVDKTDPVKQNRDCWLDLRIQFRPSQRKFKAQRTNSKLEIVKYSSPVPICLNRPVNNILDQVSALQNKASHQRICNRIHWLMDLQLHMLTRSLIDETKARNRLGEFPKLILYDQLTELSLTKEPFFRSMIRASVRASLKKLRHKLQIPIPTSMGRAMFGVVDESGQLQYGQVFIRYTKNCSLKLPGPSAERQVLKGPVMITKNPSIVAGDIRMFTAVDIPALHYLCDVVVFPRYGPRPHTDVMAGSDLDGDEYTVIWDQQLYLDRNEEAFDYTCKLTESEAINQEDLREKMTAFFVDYIKQDSIGKIANAFLVNSDLYGIKSEVCMRIAAKHMEAVDFPKTGKPPKPLKIDWIAAKEADEDGPATPAMPPERAERLPDFMEKNHEPMYISSRLNGQLYRRAKEIDDILTIATADEENANIVELDPLITWRGCDDLDLRKLVQQHYESYSANIHSILDTYGIKTEGELFSGHFTGLRNRLSDKDSDDMSFYNTTNAIEQRLFSVFSRFRRQFFETSLNGRPKIRYEEVTVPLYRSADGTKDIFRRVCVEPSEDYKKMACAYYKCAYDSHSRHLLSFPWLAWDVINFVRRTNSMNKLSPIERFTFDPLSDKLSEHINNYMEKRKKTKQFRQFFELICNPINAPVEEQLAYLNIQKYCQRYDGLVKLLFYCVKWAKMGGLLIEENGHGNGMLNQLHICILVIQFGLNHLPCEQIESNPCWLEQIQQNDQQSNIRLNLEKQHGGLGKKFLQFLQFLSSRQFRLLPFVDFSEPEMGFQSLLTQTQLGLIHKYAVQVFHKLAFTFRFDCIPSNSDQRIQCGPSTTQVREGEPFIIEVPKISHKRIIYNPEMLNKLCIATGCDNIVLRALPSKFKSNDMIRIWVSSKGTPQALNNLREILAVTAPLNLVGDCRQIFTQMAEQLYDRLINL